MHVISAHQITSKDQFYTVAPNQNITDYISFH